MVREHAAPSSLFLLLSFARYRSPERRAVAPPPHSLSVASSPRAEPLDEFMALRSYSLTQTRLESSPDGHFGQRRQAPLPSKFTAGTLCCRPHAPFALRRSISIQWIRLDPTPLKPRAVRFRSNGRNSI